METSTEISETRPTSEQLPVVELDRRLARAVEHYERSENLICFYLGELQRRRGYLEFGFANVCDYALERFGFSPRKTRYFLYLSRRLRELPRVAEALFRRQIGWSKAARVASVATAQDEPEWLEKAKELSVRELEHRIRDGATYSGAGELRLSLTDEQASVWHRALETCRKVSGEDLDASQCLELIAGEFLATYERLAEETAEREKRIAGAGEARVEGEGQPEEPEELEQGPSRHDELLCPEGSDLPSPVAVPYRESHRKILERDGHKCTYPACSVRKGLHVHHLEYRSRFGTRSKAECEHESNKTTVCFVHHRMAHAGLIGVKGKAPNALEWRRPALLETVLLREKAREQADRIAVETLDPDDFELEEAPELSVTAS